MQYRKSKELKSFCRLNDDGSMLEITKFAGSTLVIRDMDMSHRDDVLDDNDWEDTTPQEFTKAYKEALEDIKL